MCGIVGYVGKKNATNIAINALKNLEYRGYDSSGIALYEDNKFNMYKAVGKISNLEEELNKKNLSSNIAIAHTRWATHGIPNTTNAHPHKHGSVTLVHNGIIENYLSLKEKLINLGVNFYSQTDTEVAVAYINYVHENMLKEGYMNNSLTKLQAIITASKKFTGSYAFCITFDDDDKNIYCTRKGSPLLIGIGENENFVESDVSAFLSISNKYILMEENTYGIVSTDNIKLYDSGLNKLNYEIKTANMTATSYQKNGYEHFMLKEIHEQPELVLNVFKRFIQKKDETYSKINLEKYSKIDIVACGSAMHASLIGKNFFEKYLNIDTEVSIASEYRYKKLLPKKDTLVIVVSQSGETADTLAALKKAKENGNNTLAICNVMYSTIAREADKVIYTNAGPEIAVATTKGYTTQVATFASLTLNELVHKNKISYELLNEFLSKFDNIFNIFQNQINEKTTYEKVAKSIYTHENLFFIGRGIDYSLCMEGSLKLKEISYMHSEAYPAGELKHGTISLITDGTPVISIATDEDLILKTISNVQEVKSRGAYTVFVTREDLAKQYDLSFCDNLVLLPKLNEFLQEISVIIALQLIAYETAKLRKCDIDKPKNLAKSVTVE